MGYTVAEKILKAHCVEGEVAPGNIVICEVDLALGTDVTTPLAVSVLKRLGIEHIKAADRTVLVNDHFVPAKDIRSANNSRTMRNFAKEQGVKHYFEVGRSGICHVLLPEQGLVRPGMLVVGADSHTCTYGAISAFGTGVGSTDFALAMATGKLWFKVPETIKVVFKGKLRQWVEGKDVALKIVSTIGPDGANYKALEFDCSSAKLQLPDRFPIANMAIECGAKTGIFVADQELTAKFTIDNTTYELLIPDNSASYDRVIEIDLDELEPLVALPYSPANAVPAREVAGTRVDQVLIGSCTNGRYEDFERAAKILKSKRVAKHVRLIVVPGTDAILKRMIESGIAKVFVEAGGVITPSSCGACIGGHLGVLADDEVGLFTTNRNFVGRTGSKSARVYLSGVAVAAASAVAGEIIDPREL